jgi:hypothetical protein
LAAWVAAWSAQEPAAGREPEDADPAAALSYPQLREQLLRHGANWSPPQATTSAGTIAVAQRPLPYHELLDQLLQTQASGGSQRHAPGEMD